jgi:hypothetical protein
MAGGLALLDGTAVDGPRFEYLAVDPRSAGAAAEAGARPRSGPVLDRVA